MSNQQQNEEIRREMLETIRRQLVASVEYDAVRAEHHGHQHSAIPAEHLQAAVNAQTAVDGDPETLVASFRHALEAVVGQCVVVRDESDAASAIETIVAESSAKRVAVSDSPLVRNVAARMKSSATLVENVGASELFEYEVGITGAQWGIAETGTLVLESESERHRFASLIPRVHIAILQASFIRRTLAEVLAGLASAGREGLSRTVTFITGPSRTSDIELTLAIGVHGPQHLYVIVIDDVQPPR